MTFLMPTSKKRVNITLPADLEEAVHFLSKRDKVPQATKVVELLEIAIEIEEDAIWAKLAAERDTPDAVYISHEEAWS